MVGGGGAAAAAAPAAAAAVAAAAAAAAAVAAAANGVAARVVRVVVNVERKVRAQTPHTARPHKTRAPILRWARAGFLLRDQLLFHRLL